jgi:methyl-accepting chemotaxis protein PixJ
MNSPQTPTAVDKIRGFVRSNLASVIVASISLNSILTGAATWNIWRTFQNLQVTTQRQDRLKQLSSEMIYLDEVLTMSANMFIITSQPSWEKRYQDHALIFGPAFTDFLKNIPSTEQRLIPQFHKISDNLFKMESQAFKLVKEQKATAASAILLSEEYNQQKKIDASNVKTVIDSIERSSNEQVRSSQHNLELSIALQLLSLFLSGMNGWAIVIIIRGYIREQQSAQAALQTSQENLLTTNNILANEVNQREQREAFTQQENDQFQQDVSELLDVVNEIESGNLMIQAQVNDRATGLVNDTVNRLIEELGKILYQVVIAARRVEANGHSQKNITTIVTDNIDRQTKSVGKVLRLTKAMRQSAKNTVKQLANTNQSLVVLQAAVTAGQGTITTLDQNIDTLQIGSDRIVQEIKTLSEFVGLTDQFVQDQGEIVTQTQILALNAALVAARAAEQRDPKQFAIVAREFELIATQVSQLAQQTNEGLTSLEQSSSQIHRVVSAVNIDVQQLGGLVNSFTQGVKSTNEVFLTVQSVTEQAVQSGQTGSISSQKIVQAADVTVNDIEAVATLAHQISYQSKDAQQLGDQLDLLSQDLLNNMQFFRLPQMDQATNNAASITTEPVVIDPEPAPNLS